MNTADQLARLQEWLDTHPAPRLPRDASDMDQDALEQSFGGLSKRARRVQRRPVPLRVDEYGFDQHGGYHPNEDCA